MAPGELWRILFIGWTFLRHGLDELLFATPLFRPIHFLRWTLWWHWLRRDRKLGNRGERIRCALEDLGPIFVKFGQILSTRRDLLPDDIATELIKLQDRVPPFSGEVARKIIEKAYQQPLEKIFKQFETTPLASASIAQVHCATLHDGTPVVVKVIRPSIDKVIRRDIGLLYTLAHSVQRYWSEGARLHPVEVVREFEKNLLDELDLLREAASATQIKRNFANSELLYVPEIYWPWCRKQVMVMERINGIPIGDIAALRAAGVNFKQLAERGVEIFFTQVFEHNFFHADMHPGNIFVSAEEHHYLAIDFGIVGTLSPDDKRYLAENFLAFFKRDYQRVAELHVESGWVPKHTRVDEFEAAIRTVCEPIFEKPLQEISFGQLLLRLFQTARRFNMEVQPQLVLLQKTLLNIEGLGRQLYPELDLWQTAKPFLERWMDEQLGVRAVVARVKRAFPRWNETAADMPMLIHDTLQQATHGKLQLQLHEQSLNKIQQILEQTQRRTASTIMAAALIISATVLMGLQSYYQPSAAGVPLLSWLMGIAGGVLYFRGR
ncbi:ubiquinone biosynthesis regulatory protein kinase UbiB [Ectothiorhodospiraceae bacterium BW-2]|nr:ubiquinone biosynthesis regulatory protein kinase UbiB [Ectothiorhodospiraceae bacterium BW-2]